VSIAALIFDGWPLQFRPMNGQEHFARVWILAGMGMLAAAGLTQLASAADPYKIVNSSQTMGVGGIDYVYADNNSRRLYVPRGSQILVFDLDTLKAVGAISHSGGHGVAVDPKSHHGFSSRNPITMFDTTTLETIKEIKVEGNPDGILFEPASERIYVLSHSAPNVTVIDPKDGSIAGTIDLGGKPEQAASDGQGQVYVDLEDQDSIAVVDANALKVTAHYGLGAQGGGPGGLGLDAKNHILFAMCHDPATCVVLRAEGGKCSILATLPIGKGTDGGGFNPNTMEAFSSQSDGTLTIIKENSATSFEVEQTVQTKPRAKTCTLDTKNDHIILITTEAAPAPAPATGSPATPPASADQAGGGRRGGRGGPGFLDILVIGR
jgi:hypothetical protein